MVHICHGMYFSGGLQGDCTSTIGIQSAAALVTVTMPSDLSVSESFLTFIEQLNDPGSLCLAVHDLLYLTNQPWEVVF